jgi:hypothetical protein
VVLIRFSVVRWRTSPLVADDDVLVASLDEVESSLLDLCHELLFRRLLCHRRLLPADDVAFGTRPLENKGTTIERLRQLLFGASTEKTSQMVGAATPALGARRARSTRSMPRPCWCGSADWRRSPSRATSATDCARKDELASDQVPL